MSEKAAIGTLDYCSAPWLAGAIAAKDLGGASVAATSPYNARQTVRDVSGLPLVFDRAMPVSSPPPRQALLVGKRAMDIVLSLLALLALAPLMLAVAAIIKAASPGPVLFCQMREGRDGRPFRIYKFRSMYCDRCDPAGVAQTVKGDRRVNAIGRFIRRANIDELPQLFNILKGEMSLVGPRPHPIGISGGGVPYGRLVGYYHRRHVIKPGLSGWAQANGYRGPTDDPFLARARIDHDLAYIANFSLWLDIRIIVMTLVREIAGGSGS